MKKKILFILCALLLMSCLVLPVSADDSYATDVTATTSNASAYRGDAVTFIVSLSRPVSVSSGEIGLLYDGTVLTLSGGTWYLPQAETSFDTATEIGTFSFNAATEISGDIFFVTFNVPREAPIKDAEVSCVLTLADGTATPLTVTNISGSFSVLCGHIYEEEQGSDEYSHWYVCRLCGRNEEETAHEYVNICDMRCDVCGYTRDDAHDYYEEWRVNGTKHWRECRICSGKKEESLHTPGAPATDHTDQICTECGYVIEAAFDHVHNYTAEWIRDGESHYYECTECGDKNEFSAHTFTSACDSTCDTCGYTREAPHSYKTEWTKTVDGHWHECAECGERKEEGTHVPGAAATEHSAQFCLTCSYEITPALAHTHNFSTSWMSDSQNHWNLCISCGTTANSTPHVYDNTCDAICNTCSYVRTVTHRYGSDWASDRSAHWHECSVCGINADQSVHVYNNACDADCNVCGYTRTVSHKYPSEMSKDRTEHWYRCSVCDERKGVASHDYENACDAVCDDCGYERAVTHTFSATWTSDAENHWHICQICGELANEEAHVPGEGPTETENQLCTVCGHLLKVALGHTHSFNGEWQKDNTSHWHVCICGEVENKSNHTWSEGTVVKEPTVEAEGTMQYLCTVCGFEKTESIERLPDPARFWWVWLLGGVVLVGIIGGIIGYVIWRKRRFFLKINF